MEEDEALPDHLRCKRTDGRQWRCKRRVMEDKKLCELHHIQGRHRQHKQKVPDSLKLERKRKKTPNQESKLLGHEIRANQESQLVGLEIGANQESQLLGLEIRGNKKKGILKKGKRVKLKQSVDVSEALDETLKKMKLKKGDLQLELIREFLKRKVEKKKERELERRNEKDLMRELPYGLMAISQSPSPQKLGNVGPYNVKIGLVSSSLPRRCFRSKNIEPLPIGTMQAVPYVQTVANLKRKKRKKCHWCRRSNYRVLIKCSSCRKQFFCEDCIEERYFDKQEVKMACPVCCGTCSCRACSTNQHKDVEHQDIFEDKMKVDKIQQLHYLIHLLLPVLEQINRDQSIELEIEAKRNGKKLSEVHIQQAELGCKNLHCCNNCKTSIVDFHRSCANCSYNLCLSCCWEFRRKSLNGGIKACKFMYPNKRKACTSDDELLPKTKQKPNSGSTPLASTTLLRNWKACDGGSISCPHMTFRGCGDSILDLKCVFPFGWTKELEVSAEKTVQSCNFPETSDVSLCCSLCRGTDHKAGGIKLLQGVAMREDSDDNSLYYPTVQDLDDENLEHFQKHWTKGHPVVVRNVLQSTSDLSWDPVVMFCTYLEKSNANSQNHKEAARGKNCLDWCEVEIGIRQIFMGSLEGQTHANMCRQMLKLKGWLSSHLFQEQFPAHYAEIIRTLPLQEYLNPMSGLLNLAVKLPQKMPKPDVGPSIYISYGGPEELMQADLLTKLCYESYDVVNILAHATDLPISPEQLTRIKTLIKKYKARDHSKSTRNTADQNITNEVKEKLSLHSEDTEESGLQDMVGEGLQLPNGIPKVPLYSGDSHRDLALSARDKNMSDVNEHGSELDSEASILFSGTIQSYEDSDDENFFRDDIESSTCYGQKLAADSSGAQWDIFRRQDVPKLLEYLRLHSNEFSQPYSFPKHVVHPILDQSFFLDAFHKVRLKQEFNVEPWTFEQHLGEAVIIPAGCPYQIRKLKSCVNVVLEFISPENATECIKLTDELHLLPVHHKAKDKLLEVKKMTLYGISAAIEEIRNLKCAETGSALME